MASCSHSRFGSRGYGQPVKPAEELKTAIGARRRILHTAPSHCTPVQAGVEMKIEASALSCRLHPEYEVPLGADGYTFGAVVAVARLVGFIDLDLRSDRGPYSFEVQTSQGYAVVGGRIPKPIVEQAIQNQWWRGPCGWLLDAVQVLPEPVAVKGRPKLWSLPADVALKVVSQVRRT